jgi:hypothetical protein
MKKVVLGSLVLAVSLYAVVIEDLSGLVYGEKGKEPSELGSSHGGSSSDKEAYSDGVGVFINGMTSDPVNMSEYNKAIFAGTALPTSPVVNIEPSENVAPVAESFSISVVEDTPLTFILKATDKNQADLLSYSVSHSSVTLDGASATYTPVPGFNGSDSFEFSVSDGEFDSTGTVSILVSAVNDKPVLSPISDITLEEEGSVSVELSGTDEDGDNFIQYLLGLREQLLFLVLH